MKKVMTIMVAICLLGALLCGCGAEVHGGTVDMEREAVDAVEELWNKVIEYAGEDYDRFAALFRNTAEDVVSANFDGDYSGYATGKTEYALVCSAGDYYCMNIVNYIVTGEHPNIDKNSLHTAVSVSYADGEWKFDYSEDAVNALDAVLFSSEICPEDLIAANNDGRNATTFEGANYMYLDSTRVYEGLTNAEVKFAHQNEDGSVAVTLWIANGTDELVLYKHIDVSLTSGDFGVIVDEIDYPLGFMLRPMTSTLHTIVIPAERVYTGFEAWGAVSSHTTATFD